MKKRVLGYTGVKLTTIGLGTWAIGGGGWKFGWGSQDDQDSIRTIRQALEEGINWLDTAAVYGFGHSEEVVGKAIEGIRDQVFVATKCGRVEGPDRVPFGRLTRESVREEAENSLRRLNIDCIDLYQIHWPDPIDEIEEGWTEMAKLVEEGKVKYLGVSNFNVEQMKRCQAIHPIASLQPPYSMLRREIEEEILGYCAQEKIGVIPYSPMQKALLTGKVTKEWVEGLDEDDHRRRDPMFNSPQLEINMELVEGLKKIADRSGKKVSQLAIAWVMRRPEVTAAIVGARKPQQIQETVQAGEWELDQDTIHEIEGLLRQRVESLDNLKSK